MCEQQTATATEPDGTATSNAGAPNARSALQQLHLVTRPLRPHHNIWMEAHSRKATMVYDDAGTRPPGPLSAPPAPLPSKPLLHRGSKSHIFCPQGQHARPHNCSQDCRQVEFLLCAQHGRLHLVHAAAPAPAGQPRRVLSRCSNAAHRPNRC